jgi:hypothetical protein
MWGSGGIALLVLTLALDGGEWLALCPDYPGANLMGCWMGSRAGLDAVECAVPGAWWELNPGHTAHSYTD